MISDTQSRPGTCESEELDTRDLIKGIWEQKLSILIFVAVVMAGVFAVLMVITPRYSSQVQILLEDRETSFTRPDRALPRNGYRTDAAAVANQIQVLRGKDLALDIVKKFKLDERAEFNPSKDSFLIDMAVLLGLMEDPTKMSVYERVLKVYYKRLSVKQMGTSRVIGIEFSSQDAELAARIANQIADFYIQGQRRAKTDTNFEASRWLKSQIESLRVKVASSEAAVETYRSRHGLIGGRPNTTLNAQQLTELSTQLIRAKAARSEARARARLIRNMLSREGGVNAAADVLRSPLIQRLREQQVRLRRQIAEISASLLPSHPRMAQLRADLRNLNRQIDNEAKKVVKGLENEASVSAAREAELKRALDQLKKLASVNNKAEVQMRALEREAKANRDLLESFLKKYREASAREKLDSQPANARIISRATVSSIPSYPLKGPILGLALLAALMMGAVIASIRVTGRRTDAGTQMAAHTASEPAFMSRDRRDVRNTPAMPGQYRPGQQPPGAEGESAGQKTQAAPVSNVAKDYANLPVLARLPADASLSRSREFHEQQIYNLFQMAFHRSIMGRSKLVVVTSVRGGEAETKTAFDLARIMNANRLKTVLVEADIRNPELERHLDLANHPGLADFLAGSSTFSQSILRNSGDGMDVMPAGQSPSDPAQLLTPQRLGSVLTALDRIYDVMIVKTPPPGLFPETGWLAQKSCMTLLCMKSGAEGDIAASSLAYLASEGVDPSHMGIILTGLGEQQYNPQFNPDLQAQVNPQARPYPQRGGERPGPASPGRYPRAA